MRDRKGIAVGVVMFAVIVAAIVLTAILTRTMSHGRRVGKTRGLIAAEYLAEAGLVHGLDRFLAALAAGSFCPKVQATVESGAYEAVALQETSKGALGQVVVHIVAQGLTTTGCHAGCVRSYEVYFQADGTTPGQVIPIDYNRFGAHLDIDDLDALIDLVHGDWAVRRKARTTAMLSNVTREMALDEASYRARFEELKSAFPPGPIQDAWSEVVTTVVQSKLAAP